MRYRLDRLRFRLILWLWPYRRGSAHFCANRRTWMYRTPVAELSLTIRQTTEEDGYSREELVRMLRLVREQEKSQGWKVPEPEGE
jgi:hypothetical protein